MFLTIGVPLALLAGLLVARLDLLFRRGRIQRTRAIASTLFDTVATLALYSLIIWGFFYVTWYYWIGGIVVASILGGLPVRLSNMAFWATLAPALQALVLAVAVYAWVVFWPL